MVEASEAGQTPFGAPLTPGFGEWGCNPAMNLSHIEEYPQAKSDRDQSRGLDFYSRYTRTHIHTYIDFYILDYIIDHVKDTRLTLQ